MTIVDTSVFGVDLRPLPESSGTVAGRHDLYEQIAHLERELTSMVAKLEPSRRPRPSRAEPTRPHLLSNVELERTRDELITRIGLADRLHGARVRAVLPSARRGDDGVECAAGGCLR